MQRCRMSSAAKNLVKRLLLSVDVALVQSRTCASKCSYPAAGRQLCTSARVYVDPRRHRTVTSVALQREQFSHVFYMAKRFHSSERPKVDKNAPLDVHVTHVDAGKDTTIDGDRVASSKEDNALGSEDTPTTDEPVQVRFLDVPGSEETRAEKMTIVFTCTVCETRTAKTFAKLSYEKGVVVARCPGCHNLHLIADRLGWFEDKADGGWDLQKLQERMGETDCHMVTNDNVMELTLVDILGKNTKRGEESAQGAAETLAESGGVGDASRHGR